MLNAVYNLRIKVEEWDANHSEIFPNITKKLRSLQDKYEGFFRVLETGELVRGRQEGLPTLEAELRRTHTFYIGSSPMYLVEKDDHSFINCVPYVVPGPI